MATTHKIMQAFKEALQKLLGTEARIYSTSDTIKANTNSALDFETIRELVVTCGEYDMECTIQRSGAGLKIECNEFVASGF